jgi:hypothetical protein
LPILHLLSVAKEQANYPHGPAWGNLLENSGITMYLAANPFAKQNAPANPPATQTFGSQDKLGNNFSHPIDKSHPTKMIAKQMAIKGTPTTGGDWSGIFSLISHLLS